VAELQAALAQSEGESKQRIKVLTLEVKRLRKSEQAGAGGAPPPS
jgi:hypothetical protein